ncbi:MAG: peptidase inhibitor I78 [Phenylobacterium sp.]
MRLAAAIAGLALLALAGCSPSYPVQKPGQAPAAVAPPPAVEAAPRRSPIPQPNVSVRDQCGAADLQGLIGKPRTEIPVPLNPNRQRVACTTCPVTEDFDPGRLNFLFDRDSGQIREIRCG